MAEPTTAEPTTAPKVLVVSHRALRCGVHHFGQRTANALAASDKFSFTYIEANSRAEYLAAAAGLEPVAVIWNYHPTTMPWLRGPFLRRFDHVNFGIFHEISQQLAADLGPHMFDAYIAADPTLILSNPYLFKVGRLVDAHTQPTATPTRPTIGSFGFGIEGKGFARLIAQVQAEFDDALIRLHIPYSEFCDDDGRVARKIADHCKALLWKPGVDLSITHDFLSDQALLAFLSENTLNAFLYDAYANRGISSVIDFALAAHRPIAISQSEMFRHLYHCKPSICIEDRSLREIIASGDEPLHELRNEWNQAHLVWDYERIVSEVLSGPLSRFRPKVRPRKTLDRLAKRSGKRPERIYRRWFYPRRTVSWTLDQTINNPERPRAAAGDREPHYTPVTHPETMALNRVLDDSARSAYAGAIAQLFLLAPEVMSRKIAEANVQQAFVLDTVWHLAQQRENPRLLCVGAYEDSAAIALRQLGFAVDEIDPLLNYDLGTFLTKPSTERHRYDIVFSTSVIEHVPDDEAFVRDIGELINANGAAVLTCDFRDDYRPGDAKPGEDVRLYTADDLQTRLLSQLPDCRLLGDGQWRGAEPDFQYGRYRYSFASWVIARSAAAWSTASSR